MFVWTLACGLQSLSCPWTCLITMDLPGSHCAVAGPGCHHQICSALLAWALWGCTSAPPLLLPPPAPGSHLESQPSQVTLIDASIPDGACNFTCVVTSRVKPQQEIATLCLQVRQNKKEEALPYYNLKQQWAAGFLHVCATFKILMCARAGRDVPQPEGGHGKGELQADGDSGSPTCHSGWGLC